jgi:hypothetical protein
VVALEVGENDGTNPSITANRITSGEGVFISVVVEKAKETNKPKSLQV